MASPWQAELKLVGAGGEPVDFRRTIASHGLVDLPPMRLDEESWTLETTLPLGRGRPRNVVVEAGRPGRAVVGVRGPRPSAHQAEKVLDGVRHVLRLDEDLSDFYVAVAADPKLAWVASGACPEPVEWAPRSSSCWAKAASTVWIVWKSRSSRTSALPSVASRRASSPPAAR